MSDRTTLLEHSDILLKIERIAWQIYEANAHADCLYMIGIARKGSVINGLLCDQLKRISNIEIISLEVTLEKDSPSSTPLLSMDVDLKGQNVVLVDDVLNSGRTMMYASLPVLEQLPRQLQVCVLANRDHKRFPVHANFVGISLSTTLQEHIQFEQIGDTMTVYLV